MRRIVKRSFKELVTENKKELLNDKKALQKIEDKWEQKVTQKM